MKLYTATTIFNMKLLLLIIIIIIIISTMWFEKPLSLLIAFQKQVSFCIQFLC